MGKSASSKRDRVAAFRQPNTARETGPRPVSVEDTLEDEDHLFRIGGSKPSCADTDSAALNMESHGADVLNKLEEPDVGKSPIDTPEQVLSPESVEENEEPTTPKSTYSRPSSKKGSPLVQTVSFADPIEQPTRIQPKSPRTRNSSAAPSPRSLQSEASTTGTGDATGTIPPTAAPTSPGTNSLPSHPPPFHGQQRGGQFSPRMALPSPMHPGLMRPGHGFPPFRPLHTPILPQPMLSPTQRNSRLEQRMPSGYDLLARKLAGHGPGISLPPLYRRFKMLNHRLLLGIQDELCYLEDLLAKQDSDDAQNRTYLDGTVPASRRSESLEPNDITLQRQTTLETIAFKLTQYNSLLATFKSTMELNDAMEEDIHDYRAFLADAKPIVQAEATFLAKEQDLMCLQTPGPHHSFEIEGKQTPVSRLSTLAQSTRLSPGRNSATGYAMPCPRLSAPRYSGPMLRHMVLGICMAIVLPILSFPVIGGFLSRLTVVILVLLGLLVVFFQAGLYTHMVEHDGVVEGGIALGVYCAFMAVVAGTFG